MLVGRGLVSRRKANHIIISEIRRAFRGWGPQMRGAILFYDSFIKLFGSTFFSKKVEKRSSRQILV